MLAAAILALIGCGEHVPSGRPWPIRPIQIVCFSAPGGDTDTVCRTLAQAMEDSLGVKVVVVNKPGAHGGQAMREVWSRRHDGYRWGGFSVTVLIAPVMSGHHTTADDWTWFLAAGSPGVISVAADAPFQTIEELIDAARAGPRRINAAASTTGGIWHTRLIALERAAGIKFNFVPYNGSNPSQLALLSGEVTVVLTSLSEQAELIKARRIRPLAIFEPEPYEFPGLGEIPGIADAYPEAANLPIEQWIGLALPADTPADALERTRSAFEAALSSERMQTLLSERMLTPIGVYGAEADRRVQLAQRVWCWMLYDLGIADRSPESLGIARP